MKDSEKELLTTLGRQPTISMRELSNCTQYKRVSSVVRKIEQFKEQNYVWGPAYQVDYGILCKNPLHRLMCFVELGKSYKTVIDYLKLIEPLIWVYPVLSSHKELLGAGFLSSNDEKVKALLQVLKENAIITDFIVRVRRHQIVLENPDFFGDAVPSLSPDNLLTPCTFPDISFGHYDTEWSTCDIRTLSHVQGAYKSTKLIDILKKERKSNRNWTYEQIKYSFKKMINNKLISKIYYIHPYPLEQCADFFLFLQTDDLMVTQKILYNFAKGGRIHKEYTLCDDWGLIGCICHPQVVLDLLHKLDHIDEIKKKELYHLRSFPPGIQYTGEHAEFNYFNVETQTLHYPYHLFHEKIKEKLDEMSC
jgi:hypothetical protein